jgi:serine/threonine protein kinase
VTLEVRRQRTPDDPEVSLAPAQATIRRLLPAELLAEKRYAIGHVVARGGMGAILDARQSAIDRTVAMKVMLETGDEADVLRFIDEAKITGQLDHPNIVPIDELGVDEQGQVFYTMKMVRGITLKKVLELLAAGTEATVKKFTLPALLTVFQKACDAVAFAHSKGVIHRDLKPENIMLGDFGSVLVMDWGLAKVVQRASVETVHRSTVNSARSGEQFGSTLAGTIMGTPQYMAPEQARGEIDQLDARADIYALGAILFHLLALRPSVTGPTAMHIVDKVGRGEIEPLQNVTQRRKGAKEDKDGDAQSPTFAPSRLCVSHLPGGRIPDSLAAVERKAMALDPAARYGSVEDLQADLLAYQSGFATSAEQAGFAKRVLLALKRNKTASAAAALVLLAGVGFGTNAVLAGRRAELGEARANAALRNLKATAPDLLALAASEAALQRYESALKKCDAALALDPALLPAYWRRGWLLLAQEHLPEASEALRLAQAQDPANRTSAAVLPLVEKMAAASGAARYDIALIKPLYDQLSALGALGEAAPLVPHLKLGNDARLALVRERVEKWLGKLAIGTDASPSVYMGQGRLVVRLIGLRIGNLDPLRGLPIDQLLDGDCGLTSLEPLRGMRLQLLIAFTNAIEDLGPLEGMPLQGISLSGALIKDLSPLHGMPLKTLQIQTCQSVTDIRPLSGMPLEELDLQGCPSSDFFALRGMPLHKLNVQSTRFADGRALVSCPSNQ